MTELVSTDNKTFVLMAFDTLFNKRDYNDVVMEENDLVMLHGRFSGTGLRADWVAADIVRLHEGKLVEHWDVIQDEATSASSKSGLPMFGAAFPS
jgi:predicted SnoaL-like aldol condensation-catalyzing enzyme